MALGPREISDFLEISDFTARQRTPMPRLLHQIANVKFQALDPGVEMHRAPLQKSCQASDMPRWAEHMPKLGTLLGCDMPSRAKDKSQLHEPVEMENSEKETSKLPHSRVQR